MLAQVKSSFNVDLLIYFLQYDFVFLFNRKKRGYDTYMRIQPH